jgi:hypothetical protein
MLMLVQNQIVPKVGLAGDIAAALQPKNWPSLKRIVDGFLEGKGLDVSHQKIEV